MRRLLIPVAVMASVMSTSIAVGAAGQVEPKSMKIDLPPDDATFVGLGADAANDNCLTCHSADMVLYQPPLSKAVWQGEVNKMINVYKAPVAKSDVTAIVDYLNHLSAKD